MKLNNLMILKCLAFLILNLKPQFTTAATQGDGLNGVFDLEVFLRENDLEKILDEPRDFNNKYFKVDYLYSMPRNHFSANKKFADLMLELSLWSAVIEHSYDIIWAEVWDQVGARVSAKVREQAWAQLKDLIELKVRSLAGQHVRNDIGYAVWSSANAFIPPQIWKQLEQHTYSQLSTFNNAQVKSLVESILRQDSFADAYKENNLEEELEGPIEAVLEVYQIASIVMRKSEGFVRTHERLSAYLARRMHDQQLEQILNELEMPTEFGKSPVHNQLSLLNLCTQKYNSTMLYF